MNFWLPDSFKFLLSSQTWSPFLNCMIFQLSWVFWIVSRYFWALLLAVSSSLRWLIAVGVFSLRSFMFTCGLYPIRSSWGDHFATLCFQELWAYSAMGSIHAQIVGWEQVQGCKYCSIHAFIHSVCPLVLGWKVVERFCWIPRSQQRAVKKFEVNCRLQSLMIHFGRPNQGTKCFKYSLATSLPSIIFIQGMNLAALKHPWSTMVRIELYGPDWGRSVIKSIETYRKGPSST